MQLDDKVCYCFHISKRKIVNHLRIYQPRRVSQLSECGGAGTGCGWCIPFLKKYFEQWQRGEVADADDVSPDQYAKDRG
ncbi:MAG: (2Fe-2S)-binding protein, partial [Planctomycetaceae bacterium]